MKKRIMIALLLVLLAVGILGFLASRSLGISTGRCLVIDADTVILVKDGSPIVMHPRGSEALRNGIATGDEILVFHDGIRETYPAGTGVYAVFRLGSGSIDDIPGEVIQQLTELGWFS